MQTTWRKIVDHPFVQLSLLVQLTVLMLCNAAYATGMGAIKVTALGQPLRAKINLEGVAAPRNPA